MALVEALMALDPTIYLCDIRMRLGIDGGGTCFIPHLGHGTTTGDGRAGWGFAGGGAVLRLGGGLAEGLGAALDNDDPQRRQNFPGGWGYWHWGQCTVLEAAAGCAAGAGLDAGVASPGVGLAIVFGIGIGGGCAAGAAAAGDATASENPHFTQEGPGAWRKPHEAQRTRPCPAAAAAAEGVPGAARAGGGPE